MSTSLTRKDAEIEGLKRSRRAANLRAASVENRAMGKLAAAGGGVLGAVIDKYLPAIIPGASLDHPAVLAVGLALDAYALSTNSATINSVAEGLTGYLVGKEILAILP
jgi:hypothetical protein